MASPTVYGPLTKLQCCPTSDGSAAAIVVSEAFAIKHGLLDRAVEIVGMEMATDLSSTFGENSSMKLVKTIYYHCVMTFNFTLIIRVYLTDWLRHDQDSCSKALCQNWS